MKKRTRHFIKFRVVILRPVPFSAAQAYRPRQVDPIGRGFFIEPLRCTIRICWYWRISVPVLRNVASVIFRIGGVLRLWPVSTPSWRHRLWCAIGRVRRGAGSAARVVTPLPGPPKSFQLIPPVASPGLSVIRPAHQRLCLEGPTHDNVGARNHRAVRSWSESRLLQDIAY